MPPPATKLPLTLATAQAYPEPKGRLHRNAFKPGHTPEIVPEDDARVIAAQESCLAYINGHYPTMTDSVKALQQAMTPFGAARRADAHLAVVTPACYRCTKYSKACVFVVEQGDGGWVSIAGCFLCTSRRLPCPARTRELRNADKGKTSNLKAGEVENNDTTGKRRRTGTEAIEHGVAPRRGPGRPPKSARPAAANTSPTKPKTEPISLSSSRAGPSRLAGEPDPRSPWADSATAMTAMTAFADGSEKVATALSTVAATDSTTITTICGSLHSPSPLVSTATEHKTEDRIAHLESPLAALVPQTKTSLAAHMAQLESQPASIAPASTIINDKTRLETLRLAAGPATGPHRLTELESQVAYMKHELATSHARYAELDSQLTSSRDACAEANRQLAIALARNTELDSQLTLSEDRLGEALEDAAELRARLRECEEEKITHSCGLLPSNYVRVRALKRMRGHGA